MENLGNDRRAEGAGRGTMTATNRLTPQEQRAVEELRSEGFFRRDELTPRMQERMARETAALEAALEAALDEAIGGAR